MHRRDGRPRSNNRERMIFRRDVLIVPTSFQPVNDAEGGKLDAPWMFQGRLAFSALQSAKCKKVDEPGGTGDSNIDGRSPKRPRPNPQLPRESQQIPDHASPPILLQPRGSHRTVPSDDQEGYATIVGPVAAEDIHIIEKYLISQRVPQALQKTSSYNVVSSDPSKPVLYQSAPARIKSLNTETPSGASQRVIFEQILGPLAQPLISVYLRRLFIFLSKQKLI
jgi:hypothetical protein